MDDEETEQLLKTQGKPAKDETWNPKGTLPHRVGAIKNVINNRRKRIKKINRNSVFDCHLSPVGRQMAIKNTVSINIFYLHSSIVLAFSIAAYSV